MSKKQTAIRYCASTIATPLGYLAVVFESTQDPAELLARVARGEQVPGVGGPFATEDEARRAGSATLTAMQEQLSAKGFVSHRGTGKA